MQQPPCFSCSSSFPAVLFANRVPSGDDPWPPVWWLSPLECCLWQQWTPFTFWHSLSLWLPWWRSYWLSSGFEATSVTNSSFSCSPQPSPPHRGPSSQDPACLPPGLCSLTSSATRQPYLEAPSSSHMHCFHVSWGTVFPVCSPFMKHLSLICFSILTSNTYIQALLSHLWAGIPSIFRVVHWHPESTTEPPPSWAQPSCFLQDEILNYFSTSLHLSSNDSFSLISHHEDSTLTWLLTASFLWVLYLPGPSSWGMRLVFPVASQDPAYSRPQMRTASPGIISMVYPPFTGHLVETRLWAHQVWGLTPPVQFFFNYLFLIEV